MNLHDIVSDLILDAKGPGSEGFLALPAADSSIGLFAPELIVCAAIVLMLLVRVFDPRQRISSTAIAFFGTVAALLAAAPWTLLDSSHELARRELFTGLLVFDGFSVLMRSILLFFVLLLIVLVRLTRTPAKEDSADVLTLVLGGTLGMMLMTSANHLLMVFLAVEMASVPSYVLAGVLRGKKLGSEAALKYSVYGAGAAGVMLYGISLIAGMLNTVHLPSIALELSQRWPMQGEEAMALALGGLMIAVGLAFKLSAVPFHFWCPDVFEGSTAEVNAFLSVASKAAALALLVRVAVGFGMIPENAASTDDSVAVRSSVSGDAGTLDPIYVSHRLSDDVSDDSVDSPEADEESAAGIGGDGLAASRAFIGRLIALFAALTCTFGNFAAYGQTNIKRLLAYSTIAHAGYMMMPVPAVMALASVDPVGAKGAIAALGVYVFVYVFMNLGAFAVVAILRDAMQSEEIADYGGLIRRAPALTVCFAILLFSLIGLPPLAGFIGKLAVFAALADAWRATSETYLLALLLVGGVNTAISLVYYMRVVKVMTMDAEPETRRPFTLTLLPVGYVALVTAPVVAIILSWDLVNRAALAAAERVLS